MLQLPLQLAASQLYTTSIQVTLGTTLTASAFNVRAVLVIYSIHLAAGPHVLGTVMLGGLCHLTNSLFAL